MQNHNIYTKFFAANANKTFLVFASGRNSGESLTGAQLLERCQMHWDEYPNQRCTENPNHIYIGAEGAEEGARRVMQVGLAYYARPYEVWVRMHKAEMPVQNPQTLAQLNR